MIPVTDGGVYYATVPRADPTGRIVTNKNVINWESKKIESVNQMIFSKKRNTSLVCCSYFNFVPNFLFRFRVFDTLFFKCW